MKEIFTPEYKAFIEKHRKEKRYEFSVKEFEQLISSDPRWNPEILNIKDKEDCPNSDGADCCHFEAGPKNLWHMNYCTFDDEKGCWVLKNNNPS